MNEVTLPLTPVAAPEDTAALDRKLDAAVMRLPAHKRPAVRTRLDGTQITHPVELDKRKEN